MKNYIGITIGPIYKFMSMTATPAGLWGTSYLFSYIAKNLCQGLLDNGITPDQFITPALFDQNMKNGKVINPKPGVGLFHDRIVVELTEAHSINLDTVNEIIAKVIEQTANGLAAAVSGNLNGVHQYLKDSLQIYALETKVAEDRNPLLDISSLLDALELQQKFVQEEKINYVLQLMENSTKNAAYRNELIKKSFLVSDFIKEDTERFEDWPLTKDNDGKIRDLEDIASGGHKPIDMKKYQYYAVIQADGDHMGSILKSFEGQAGITGKIQDFSRCCFNYCIEAVNLANAYDAVTIYTGGDDFLVLAPLENKNGETIFDFILKLSKAFNNCFDKYKEHEPSLSFGVMMTYCKLPLYESFEKAVDLLFAKAKGSDKRNALAFHLQKHSGQSVNMKISHIDQVGGIYQKISDLLRNHWTSGDQNNFLKSVVHHLADYRSLFKIACQTYKDTKDVSVLDNAFNNVFDAADQRQHGGYIDEIKQLIMDLTDSAEEYEVESDKKKAQDPDIEKILDAVDAVLRLMKFFVEPGREA